MQTFEGFHNHLKLYDSYFSPLGSPKIKLWAICSKNKVLPHTTKIYIGNTSLLPQKGCTLKFITTISGTLQIFTAGLQSLAVLRVPL